MKSTFPGVLYFRVFVICYFLLLIARNTSGIAVTGKVSVQQGSTEGAVVHTVIDGHRLDIHKVDKHGKYQLELAFNHNFELIFAMEGNFSQKIVIETLVPDKVLQSNPLFKPISLDVKLFTEVDGINLSFIEKPSRKIYYNSMLNDYVSEVYFDDTQIARQIEKAVFHSQIINKEIGFLEKLSPFELAEMKREYYKIIGKAGKIYNELPVMLALNDDVNELLGAIILAAEMDKEQNAVFDDFIHEADNLLNQKRYTSARIAYKRALSINPDDYYAEGQCDLIEVILEDQTETEQYNLLIAQADNSFNEMLYSEAAKNYRNALSIKPYEQYAKSKLEKANNIIENEYKNAGKSTSYKQTIKEAEVMYQKQFYEKSLASYFNALNLEPGDNLATRKIAEVENVMAYLSDKLMYNKFIASADKFYQIEAYPEAKRDYYAAAEIIPDNKYALFRINAINEKLELNENFEYLVASANDQFAVKKYHESKENYLQASIINANDKFVKSRIQEINNLLKAQKVNENYRASNQANSTTGNVFNNKPEVSDVQNEIQLTHPDKDYLRFVELADSTFRENQYALARGWYNRALGVKANEKYPIDQLKEIENKIAERMVGQSGQQFDNNMQKAATAFDAKNYNVARFWYKKALELRPEDAEVKNRLKEIDEAMKK